MPGPLPLYDFAQCAPCADRSQRKNQGQEKPGRQYSKAGQSENCDVCVTILYWRIPQWTSTSMMKTAGFSMNCREASPSHLIKPGEAEGEGIREQQKVEKVLDRTGRIDFKER